jgi:hypothetical protein
MITNKYGNELTPNGKTALVKAIREAETEALKNGEKGITLIFFTEDPDKISEVAVRFFGGPANFGAESTGCITTRGALTSAVKRYAEYPVSKYFIVFPYISGSR